MKPIFVSSLFMVVAFLAGCSQGNAPPSPVGQDSNVSHTEDDYRLPAEPAGAKGVIDVRKDAKDGDDVVIVGRVGGSQKPFVEGRAAFTIVDPSLVPCNEKEGDTCATPWDFCCDTKEDLARATVMVRFVDAQGKTLAHDAKALLGVEPLQTVVVKGKAKRDSEGNLTIVATSVYVRPKKTTS